MRRHIAGWRGHLAVAPPRAHVARSRRRLARALALLGLLALACSMLQPPAAPTPTTPPPEPTAPPTPEPARPEDVAQSFLDDWQQGSYDAMYDLLSADAQLQTTRDLFDRRYQNIRGGIGETKVVAHPTGAAQPAPTGVGVQVPFNVTRTLTLFGDVTEDNTLPLVQEQGAWKVDWSPGLIFSGLSATTSVRVTSSEPKRGRILDRAGAPLADNGSILSIGVVPGDIKDEPALLSGLSDALGIPQDQIKQRYQGGQPTWFMPITDRPESDRPDLEQKIGSLPGVALQDKPARVYPLADAAAHVVGYVTHPTADELRQLSARGYDESDWVGRSGLEATAEAQLAGTKGGAIQIVDQAGRVQRTVVQKPAVDGQDVTLTLDNRIQSEAASALGDKTGSVVVMDPRDNAVLALASRPSFDPNQFVIGLSDQQWQDLNGDAHPLQLRATESAYPTGSIFKVITMAAGLEQGVTTPTETFNCGSDWTGLPGVTLHNWEPQGILDLREALTESCNPAFYELGLRLDHLDPTVLPTFAHTFGLGAPTHIQDVDEVPGTVPDPAWKQQQLGEGWTSGDSVNLAIGQGYLLATPLQMANAYAALARGGSLLAPRLLAGTAEAQPIGSLKLSDATLAAILAGMQRVTSTPAGTASYAFKDEKLPIAAKTGSAENENPDAHAWFVGFTPPQKPTLLVLVMIEGGQHGGTVAAPVARDLVDFAAPLSR